MDFQSTFIKSVYTFVVQLVVKYIHGSCFAYHYGLYDHMGFTDHLDQLPDMPAFLCGLDPRRR